MSKKSLSASDMMSVIEGGTLKGDGREAHKCDGSSDSSPSCRRSTAPKLVSVAADLVFRRWKNTDLSLYTSSTINLAKIEKGEGREDEKENKIGPWLE